MIAEKQADIMDAIMAYEAGVLDQDAIVALFQYLVDTGMAWTLQGSYGRTAMDMLKAGIIQRKQVGP